MKFRQWLHEMWLANVDERIELHLDTINIKDYFDRYKWWLRREYRYQQKAKVI